MGCKVLLIRTASISVVAKDYVQERRSEVALSIWVDRLVLLGGRSKTIIVVALLAAGGLLLVAGEGWYLGAGYVPAPPIVSAMIVVGVTCILLALVVGLVSKKWLLLVSLVLFFFLMPVIPSEGVSCVAPPIYVSLSFAVFRGGLVLVPSMGWIELPPLAVHTILCGF